MTLFCYKVVIAYDGADFSGWQRQKHGASIQAHLEAVCAQIFSEPIHIVGSGRTDSGVHALGQVAHFMRSKPIERLDRLRLSMNALLPTAIRVLSIETASPDFHARFSAVSKVYRYHVATGSILSPFLLRYRLHWPKRVDYALMQEAATLLLGVHDFTSLANLRHGGSPPKDGLRRIDKLDLQTCEDGFFIEVKGSGFLYKMVRNMVGLLLMIGEKKFPLSQIHALLEKKNRIFAPATVSPSGLFLVSVQY